MEEINKIVEDTTGPNAENIATTDENLSVDGMYQQAALPSLGRQIFAVQPMHGPTAAIFNVKKNDAGDGFKLLRNNVEVYPSTPIKTNITQETIEDIKAQYGEDASKIIGILLRGLSNDDENAKTIAFLDAESVAGGDLTLSDSGHAETTMFEVTKKVHELVLKMNSKNLRTYEAFCVIPYSVGAAIAALSSYVGGSEGDKDERGLFLAQIGQTKFYMNPVATSNTMYVGLKDSRNDSKSSATFSPYVSQITEARNADSGELSYFIFNRYAITASPLHETGNEMLFKFNLV